jgi:hypothetical protein
LARLQRMVNGRARPNGYETKCGGVTNEKMIKNLRCAGRQGCFVLSGLEGLYINCVDTNTFGE